MIVYKYVVLIVLISFGLLLTAQTIQYTMPEETELHEGTWLQWPHNHLYGPWYRDDVEQTFVGMTNALQAGENVHIIAYDSSELSYIQALLTTENVPLTNIDFKVHQTDDVWARDNGPMFVYDTNNNLTILDWGFNGWGGDTPFSKCDVIPQSVSKDIGIPIVDLNAMVLEGGAIEHDGHGTMMATRSSITHSSRNPSLTETQIENYLTTYIGITNFIWLDGVYGLEITDMHIDGYVKFANDSTIVTLNSTDLDYWAVTPTEVSIINSASNINGEPYTIVTVPLTQNDVITTRGTSLGYKGSYCNYYIGNTVVLVPTYSDVNDAVAINIIQGLYPNRTVVGIDVRDLYEYGGMIHCITQQQPVDLIATSILEPFKTPLKQLKNYPNPFNEYTIIEIAETSNSLIIVDVYNVFGQNVISLTADEGANEVKLNAADFTNGIYLFTVSDNGHLVGGNTMVVNK